MLKFPLLHFFSIFFLLAIERKVFAERLHFEEFPGRSPAASSPGVSGRGNISASSDRWEWHELEFSFLPRVRRRNRFSWLVAVLKGGGRKREWRPSKWEAWSCRRTLPILFFPKRIILNLVRTRKHGMLLRRLINCHEGKEGNGAVLLRQERRPTTLGKLFHAARIPLFGRVDGGKMCENLDWRSRNL